MTYRIKKPAWKLTGIVKITIPEVFPEMKPLGKVIIIPVYITVAVVFFFPDSSWLLLVVTVTHGEVVSWSVFIGSLIHVTRLCQSTGQVIPTPWREVMKHCKEMLTWSMVQHKHKTCACPICDICTPHICPHKLDVDVHICLIL